MLNQAPLTNVRVLDLSRLIPGPYCSRILTDFGAEVIKIEHPAGGDWLRHLPPLNAETGMGLLFRTLNRGKKSLTLNLKSEQGHALLLRLAETADVLLEGFRPGVMERLGLDYQRLAAANPRLVYCALTGFGLEGPYRERPAHDVNYIALAGLLDLTGTRGGPPVIPGVPIADLTGGLWAAIGIMLALLARERSGEGQRVDASLLGAALACMPVALAQHWGGQPPARGATELTGGVVCYNVYATQDDKYMTLGALEPHFWAAFCRQIGREDLLEMQFAPAVPGAPVFEALCALFRSRTRQEWLETFAGIDACCEPLYTPAEAADCGPVQALGMVGDQELLSPVNLAAYSGQSGQAAPSLGQDTAALLNELGYDEAAVAMLREQGVV